MTRGAEILQTGLDEGLYTHAVYGVMRHGRLVSMQAFGEASEATIFDLASLTKPLSTATLLLQLVEQGRLHLKQSVGRFFEDVFGPLPHLSGIELKHLLTHTSGLPPIPRWPDSATGTTRQELIRSVLSTPTLRPAGVGYTYSDTGYLLLGEIIAHTASMSLDQCFQDSVAGPLGLTTLGFCPKALENIAPTGPELPGTVHDPRARDLGRGAGHAGLFGTATDVLVFAEAIRLGGLPILSKASVARMAESQIPAGIGGQSFGWFCMGNDYLPSGDLFSDRAFGHSGFTGTMLLIDPEYDLSLCLLTNRVVNQMEDGSRFLRLRRLWLNTVAASQA